jgi:hypothetical protein
MCDLAVVDSCQCVYSCCFVVGLVAEPLSTKEYVMKYFPRSRPYWEHSSTEMKRVCTFLPGVCICLPPCMVQCSIRQLFSSKRGRHSPTDHEGPEAEKR